jgi:hypothetical protein
MLKNPKLWGLLFVAFIVYWLVQQPGTLMSATQDTVGLLLAGLAQVFRGLIRAINSG